MLPNNICNDVTQTSVTNMLQQQHVPVAPATTTLLHHPVTCTLSIHRVVQNGSLAMPAWYKDACWLRGELATEDDGSLNAAALAELYCSGRHHWSGGVVPGSTARSFADAACGAVERATSEVGDTEELASAFAELQHLFTRAEGDDIWREWPRRALDEQRPPRPQRARRTARRRTPPTPRAASGGARTHALRQGA